MRASINTKSKFYGVKVNKSGKTIYYKEEYVKYNLFLTLPLGELLFSSLELSEFVSEAENISVNDLINKFFSVRKYDLSVVFFDFCVDFDSEIEKLKRIKEYLDLCIENKRLFSVEHLKGVALKILEQDNPLFKLFENKMSKYYIRRIISGCDIPFGFSSEGIANALSNEYNEFSFYTRTQIKSLSELCLLSIFEIIETGQIVQRCGSCKRYFISKRSMDLCDRPSEINDFRGCKNYNLYLYRKQYKEDEVVKEYFRIYNKLQARTKSKKYFDILVFEEFKNGWNELNKSSKNNAEQKKRKMEFLSMERWK